MGSWKTIPMSRPRRRSSSRSGRAVRSRPSKRMEPATISACGRGCRPMIDSAVIDLPEPDSPTIPTVVLVGTAKLTPSTAWRVPSGTRMWVFSPSTVSNGSKCDALAAAA